MLPQCLFNLQEQSKKITGSRICSCIVVLHFRVNFLGIIVLNPNSL